MGLIKLAFNKEAGLWDGILNGGLAVGKTLMRNNTLKNAAIGTGIGAVTGAVNANQGERMSGALKGGLLGGAIGGVSTAGSNIYKNMKPGIGPGMSFGGALKQEGGLLKNSLIDAKWQGQNAFAVGSGKASSITGRPASFNTPTPKPAPTAAAPINPDSGFSKRYSSQLTPPINLKARGIVPTPAPVPQGSGPYKSAYERGFGASSRRLTLSDIKVPSTDPRLLNVPSIMRQGNKIFTEGDLAGMGIR